MADEVLKMVAENKIKELELKLVRLDEKLNYERAGADEAWKMYGSELAGDLLDGVKRVEKGIETVEKQISLLTRFISGGLDISQESSLRSQCRELDKEMTRINDLKNSTNAEIEEIIIVKDLLGVDL